MTGEFGFGVSWAALGVGGRVGLGVSVGKGVHVLIGRVPAGTGVGGMDLRSGKPQAIANTNSIDKRVNRLIFTASPLTISLSYLHLMAKAIVRLDSTSTLGF